LLFVVCFIPSAVRIIHGYQIAFQQIIYKFLSSFMQLPT
jgi:hypothetical protein